MSVAAPRVCIVGAGLMGRWHAHALARLGIPTDSVVDPDGAAAHRLAARHPGCRHHESLDAARRDRGADVVHVCTPRETHRDLITDALDGGAHVIAEKPVAATLAETRALVDLAGRRKRLLCPVHQYPFQDGVLRALRDRHALGTIRHVDTVACSAGADGTSDAERARIALEILPHPLSLLDAFFPGSLPDVSWHGVAAGPGEFRVSGIIGGASAGLLISMRGRPTRNTMRIVGDGGSVHLDLFHGFSATEAGRVSQRTKILRPLALSASTLGAATVNLARRAARREPAYPGLRELFRRCYRSINTGSAPPVSLQSTLDVAAALGEITQVLGEPNTANRS